MYVKMYILTFSMNTTIPASKARKDFFKLIQSADRPGASVTITVEGEAKVVMMSVEDFEGWKETLEVMEDKALMKGIREGLTDLNKKKTLPADEVKKMLKL